MPINALYLGVFWMIYYTLHSALASERVKEFFAQKIPAIYNWYRMLYSFFAGINFALLLWFHIITPSANFFSPNQILAYTGIVLLLLAVIIFLIAIRQYRLSFWVKSSPDIESQSLITTGINAYVRHPLYFAVLIGLLGIILIYTSWKNLIFSLITVLYIIIGTLLEEQKLLGIYKTDYVEYRKRVKMLIPFIV